MKNKIETLITLAVLLAGVSAYFYNYGDLKSGLANTMGTDLLSSECDISQGIMSEAKWQNCQRFTEKILNDSNKMRNPKIAKLREEIIYMLQQISELSAK